MSGGRLVVLDRLGRDVKRFPLAAGLATLGSDPRCDIRVMLPAVAPHHATVVVHANQTVVRNVGDGETLVNSRPVSVAALGHGDLLTVGGRHLRWEYAQPQQPRPLAAQPALYTRPRASRKRRQHSDAAPPAPRSPALRLALEMQQRASMPGSAGGKQVAIVQPQRRATTEQNDINISLRGPPASPPGSAPCSPPRSPAGRKPPRAVHSATKASLWIESRKTTTPRSVQKAPALRLQALRRLASLSKVPPPASIDHTKQAAIMLMTGHTPKSKLSSPNLARRTPSFLVKKPSPVNKTPRGRKSSSGKSTPKSAKKSPKGGKNTPKSGNTPSSGASTPRSEANDATPARGSSGSRKSCRSSGSRSVTILEISDTEPRKTSPRSSALYRRSPLLPSPKKSSLKDPRKSKSSRKTESIKFDLSNLEDHSQNRSEGVSVAELSKSSRHSSFDDLALRYSDTSSLKSPSPRRSIHSRSSRILENSLGTTFAESPARSTRSTLTPQAANSSRSRSFRGSAIAQKALQPDTSSRYSRRTTKTLTDQSCDNTVASAFRTRTLSPRSPEQNLETYSIVDLVSMESNESGRSVYNSAGSANSSAIAFGTPRGGAPRKTRSTIDPALVESSTPYVAKVLRKSTTRSRSSPNISRKSSSKENVSRARSSTSSRRSKSLTTPEDTLKHISVNSTRVSRVSRSRSRISESDLLLISDNSYVEDESPRSSMKSTSGTKTSPLVERSSKKSTSGTKTSPLVERSSKKSTRGSKTSPLVESKRNSSARPSPVVPRKSTRKSGGDVTPAQHEGTSTPENRHSPQEIGTPILSIQSFLDSSQSSLASHNSARKGRVSANLKRKTIGAIRTEPKNRRTGLKSKSLNFTARRGLLRLSNDSSLASNKADESTAEEKMVTPKSAVKLVQEAVKNKHSTAKKPQSKRSIIDDLDESDIVKQLFNSPVKRKLSQSMTEFSRKQLFDDEEVVSARRPTRNTIALTGRTPDRSLLDQTEVFTPERFVSPIGTPANSPDLVGIKRLFRTNTPQNRGVKGLLRSPRTRASIKNDLTNVSGVKKVFAKSPKNRLSDVRVKEVFAEGPKNDLRRVSGVKSLFRAQKERASPTNGLHDVRGVKKLFQRNSPANDLRRVSGVKRALQRGSPRNDLGDVRGVRRMFREEKRKQDLSDVSGVEELFNESAASRDTDRLFDQLLGKPPIKAVYSKSLLRKSATKPKTRRAKSLRGSIDLITNNVEEWLERELQKRLHRDTEDGNKGKNTTTNRELQMLVTDTVEGSAPIRASRARSSAAEHTLPLKKRSLVDQSRKETLEVSSDVRISRASANSSLPLKKRVLHSTPLKGRRPAAPALARVSPIPAERDASIRSDRPTREPTILQENQPKGRRITKARTETEASKTPKPSPKPTRTSKPPFPASPPNLPSPPNLLSPPSSPKPRTTRARAPPASPKQAKKSRPSLVIAKKSPVMSPKAAPRTRRAKAEAKPAQDKPKNTRTRKQPELLKQSPKASPKKARAGRSKPTEVEKLSLSKEAKPATPKRTTRAKVLKATVVISKPSPLLKPRRDAPKRNTRKTMAEDTSDNRDSKRRKLESPKESQAKTRKTNEPKTKKTEPETTPVSKPGRRTRAAESEQPKTSQNTETKGKSEPATRRKVQAQGSTQSEPTTRRRRNQPENITVIPEIKTRKRKTTAEEVVPAKVPKKTAETNTTKEKKTAAVQGSKKTETKPTRGKKPAPVQDSEKVKTKPTRGKKAAPVQESEKVETKPTRGKKAAPVQESEKVETKPTRGKKAAPVQESEKVETKPTRGKKAVEVQQIEATQKRAGRSAQAAAAAHPTKATRSKKTATAVEPAPVKTTRKRNTAALPAKVVKEAAKKSPASHSTRTRAAKQELIELPAKPAGRSRRR